MPDDFKTLKSRVALLSKENNGDSKSAQICMKFKKLVSEIENRLENISSIRSRIDEKELERQLLYEQFVKVEKGSNDSSLSLQQTHDRIRQNNEKAKQLNESSNETKMKVILVFITSAHFQFSILDYCLLQLMIDVLI